MKRKATFACMAIVAISDMVFAAQNSKQDANEKQVQPASNQKGQIRDDLD